VPPCPASRKEEQLEIKWTIWDLNVGRSLFSCPIRKEDTKYFWVEFSPENMLVEFHRGKPTFRKLPSGDLWMPEVAANLPYDPDKGVTFELASARDGRLLVVVPDAKGDSVRDLLSGREVCTLPRSKDSEPLEPLERYRHGLFPGGWIQHIPNKEKIEVRELPSGRLRGELEFSNAEFKTFCGVAGPPYWGLTPDCNFMVRSGEENFVWDVRTGKRRRLNLPEHMMSLDHLLHGNFLVLLVDRPPKPNHPWVEWLLNWLGPLPQDGPEVVLYNLMTGAEVASVRAPPDPELHYFHLPAFARFSLDGKSLAASHGTTLHIYDFPLRRPWLMIAAYALMASVIAWVIAWLLGRGLARR
jgi:hypothetical protein